ncbi:hypothetical protein I858_004585 [Planococcus versutus]|uniref:Uncharacterized protein n=1 Tax=Planococcus versutus TaxID=1302659 RepID=A0A1B1RZG4_9BACL|nr:hypothetical protein I858_004585 [Planococcus versutus]
MKTMHQAVEAIKNINGHFPVSKTILNDSDNTRQFIIHTLPHLQPQHCGCGFTALLIYINCVRIARENRLPGKEKILNDFDNTLQFILYT